LNFPDPTAIVETASPDHKQEIVLRVSNGTNVHKLATSVRKNVENGNAVRVVLSCIGVQTINQAIKAVAIANERTSQNGYLLLLYPYFFTEQKTEEVENTIMRFVVIRYLIGS
jgi:stage V sporulation protein SpoVS